MAKPVQRSSWRKARDKVLKKQRDEISDHMKGKGNIFYYIKYEIKRTWEAYAIIAGGTFLGILLLIFWIMYLNWDFRSTYKDFLD